MNSILADTLPDPVIGQSNHRCVARFVAIDPIVPVDTRYELEKLMHRFHSVFAWKISADGEVTVEFDRTRISDATIEEALGRLGFSVTHVFYEQDVDGAELQRILG